MPVISVLMATYNTPYEWLKESIQSILDQTHSDFEFIIVDDCSTDDMSQIQREITDSRVRWVRNAENLGLTKSLNVALGLATGQYIARMDADDVSLPERFAEQVKFMEEHRDVIVCGSYRRAFGIEDKNEIWNIPNTREEQQVELFFSNCGLTHPTAMFRKSMLDEFGITYNESYRKAQDYGIWVQCTRFAPMAMIPKVLLKYRKSDQQISSVAGKPDQRRYASMVRADQLTMLGISANESDKALHESFCRLEPTFSAEEGERWVQALLSGNAEYRYFDAALFASRVESQWFHLCKKAYKEQGDATFKTAYRRAYRLRLDARDKWLALKGLIAKIIRK